MTLHQAGSGQKQDLWKEHVKNALNKKLKDIQYLRDKPL